MTEHLPRVREEVFVPSYANYFGEAELLPRAVVVVLVDLINVVISGATGMGCSWSIIRILLCTTRS